MSELEPELPSFDRAADERTTLVEMLEYFRAVLLRKASGLDAEALATTLPPSDLTLGGLLLHLAYVEDVWFGHRFAGDPPQEPFASADWDADQDWELHHAASMAPDELRTFLIAMMDRSRAVLAGVDSLDVEVAIAPPNGSINMRWILVHMIEEYARHCGHADFLRESIDGVVDD